MEKQTPVLLITFNRPSCVTRMVDALREAGITELYVFKDGPRPLNKEDQALGDEIRSIISSIDWPCHVVTNYMNNNLGCGYGPFSAISWAFQYTDKLIILEDDCVPTKVFFDFCNYLLEKYKDDSRVRHISGYSQFEGAEAFQKYDYVFTQYAPTWGWATWKRVWDNFDMQERLIKPFFKTGGFTHQFSSPQESMYFNRYYWNRPSPLQEMTHSWDYQYAVHSKMNGALSIVPAKNLIRYIGEIGTHSFGNTTLELSVCETYKVEREPDEIEMIPSYEQLYFKKYCSDPFLRRIKFFIMRTKNRIFGRPDFI